MIVTIDGPAGTGKSTVARRLAEALGFEYLDTGAMYRMIAVKTLADGADPEDPDAVAAVADAARMDFSGGRPLLNGVDVGSQLRTSEATRVASLVAQIPAVREALVARQREIAGRSNIVCEGRDQGTVAFPHAECKFFLTADPLERARRRHRDLIDQGQEVDFEELVREQHERDRRDEERAIAPLKPAADAAVIETTSLDADAVVELLAVRVRARMTSGAAL